MTKSQPEFHLQTAICQYLNVQFPKLMYASDTIASLRLSIPQQNRNKLIQKKGFKMPDLMIYEPNDRYFGLFIELKVVCPYKLNGDLHKNEHLEAQQKTINDLNEKGYYACFSWTFEMTLDIIHDYLNNRI